MKKLIILLLSFSQLPALAMEPAQLKYTQNELDLQLLKALDKGNATEAKSRIQAGANVNARRSNIFPDAETLLMSAVAGHVMTSVGDNNNSCIRLLLEEGADMRIAGRNLLSEQRDTALKRATIRGSKPEVRKEKISLLITCSRFFPLPKARELQDSQRRTRARISVLNQICPELPNDVKRLILARDAEVWQDACNTPLRLHTEQHHYLTRLPLEVLRTLIRNNALNTEKTIAILSNYKMEQLRPLMLEAAPLASGPQPDNIEIKPLINPDLLEQNYGEAIRSHMRDCLIPPSAGWLGSCSIQ